MGLSSLTATLAHGEGLRLAWLPMVRAALLLLAGAWSLWLAYRQLRHRTGAVPSVPLAAFAFATAGVLAAWVPFVWRVI